MEAYRTEIDLLGAREVPGEALYGVHTLRAMENFELARRPVHAALIHAYGAVKLACARTNHELTPWEGTMFSAMESACLEMMSGQLDTHVVVDALQGGAGTSTNMNVNEVLANRALQLLGKPLGDYGAVHPLNDINRHQSTNDTYPTALRVAAIAGLRLLEREVVALEEAFQAKEKEFSHIPKLGRTQLQDAVPTTLGRSMSAFAEAFSRDRWRIYKCEERLRTVNLGGTAIGTGIGAPRQFIFRAVEHLRSITGYGLARAENLIEATQNADVFVEVSGILKACAANLLKCSGDLRLMSSGPDAGLAEIRLPARQAGSSIMPGKVNPVIPEAVSQAAMMCAGYDQAIFQACALGSLELNPFLPLVADALLHQMDLLARACAMFRGLCVAGITPNEARCRSHLEGATASATALMESMGYEVAQEIAKAAAADHKSIRQVVLERGLMDAATFDSVVHAESLTRLGVPMPKEY